MKGLNLTVGLVAAAAVLTGVVLSAAVQSSTSSESKSMKLVGCLERDTPASSAGATTASDITAFKLTGIDASAFKGAGPGGKDLTEVRLWSKEEFELIDHVGKQVAVDGKFADQAAAPPPGNVVTVQGPVIWMPVFDVSSFHSVASSCK
jgi:hypothetical protein